MQASFPSKSNDTLLVGNLRFGQLIDNYVSTPPYLHDDITWCIQSAQEVPRWLMIFLTFSDFEVLLIPIITCLCVSTVAWLHSAFDGTNLSYFQVAIMAFTIAIAYPTEYMPVEIVGKLWLFFGSLISVALNVIYLSVNTSFISVPLKYPQVRTIDGLMKREFTLFGTADTLDSLRYLKKVRN